MGTLEHIVLKGFVCYHDQSAILTRTGDVTYSSVELPLFQHQNHRKNTGSILHSRKEMVVIWMDKSWYQFAHLSDKLRHCGTPTRAKNVLQVCKALPGT